MKQKSNRNIPIYPGAMTPAEKHKRLLRTISKGIQALILEASAIAVFALLIKFFS